MNPAAEVWEKVKVLMGSEMTATTMNTWFDDAEAVSLEESRFVDGFSKQSDGFQDRAVFLLSTCLLV